MSLARMLDTDICVEVLRRRDRALLERLSEHPVVAVSSISASELAYGAARSNDPGRSQRAVDQFLAFATVLDVDDQAARHAGDIRADLAQQGTPIGAYDVLIAGHARARSLIIVTRNTREFERVAGLRVECW